jgi:hypothetical protein
VLRLTRFIGEMCPSFRTGVDNLAKKMHVYAENLSEGEHLLPIREERKIYNVCGDVRLDTAAVAARRVLLGEEPYN